MFQTFLSVFFILPLAFTIKNNKKNKARSADCPFRSFGAKKKNKEDWQIDNELVPSFFFI